MNNPTGPSKEGTALQLMQDSIYLYTQEAYLWNDQLPSYAKFNPRSFTNSDPKAALDKELDALSQYAINPNTNKPYEYYPNSPGLAKYSFVDDGTEGDALNGIKGDFGFDYNYNQVDDIRVLYAYPGSPAGKAGITRGCQILSINDDSDISYDGLFSDGTKSGTGTSVHNNFVYNAIFQSSGTIKMTIKRLNGTTFTANLSAVTYNVDPILKDTVMDAGVGHKIGYLVFNSFVSDDVADSKLDAAFADFTSKGVTDLVIDLRYNGGGYVSTAEYLDNLIVPPSKTGVMYKTYYNSTLTAGKEKILKNQVFRDNNGLYTLADYIDQEVANNSVNFAKKGSLNVGRVFFIVTGGTASASELTINNLRPQMDVQLVGETSYGKPVGFFGIDINKYTLYTPEFSTKNSAGQGDYYAGMTPGDPDYPGVNDLDDYTKDFGDPTEKLLAHIFSKVKTNAYNTTNKVTQSTSNNGKSFSLLQSREKTLFLNKNKFTGMILKKSKVKR